MVRGDRHVRHEENGLRYVYGPVASCYIARCSALRHLVETFFEGSVENAITALLIGKVSRLSREELDRLMQIVAKSTKEGRR